MNKEGIFTECLQSNEETSEIQLKTYSSYLFYFILSLFPFLRIMFIYSIGKENANFDTWNDTNLRIGIKENSKVSSNQQKTIL